MYKKINMEEYPRREHFNHFKTMEQPMVTVTTRIDITDWLKSLKKTSYPFFLSFQYAVAQAANKIPEFRQRIKDGEIIEYDFSNPSYTLALPDETFRFCPVNANQPFDDYIRDAKLMEEIISKENLHEEDPLKYLFVSTSPWFDYESLSIAYPNKESSNPNFIWGKYTKDNKLYLENGSIKEKEVITMPLTIMANHALIDAVHIKKFLENLQEELNRMMNQEFYQEENRNVK